MKALDAVERAELEACYGKCTCATCAHRRALIAKVLSMLDTLDASWLVKDFNILYRAACDVSESDTRATEQCPPPMRQLRAQLDRLEQAFRETEEVKRYLRERELGA